MESYFKVERLENLKEYRKIFNQMPSETISIENSHGRILAEDILSDINLPGFTRSTMDGYAVKSKDTFGASESSPQFLQIKGEVLMGEVPDFSILQGEAASIATGGMLPQGCDSVVMIEHTEKISKDEIELYKSISPGTNIVQKDDDFKKDTIPLTAGTKISSKNIGILAALGKSEVIVHKRPVIGIISTGDEVIDCCSEPTPGQVRDLNRYIISALAHENNFKTIFYGLSGDSGEDLFKIIKKATSESDLVVISGGSSVGMRDITIDSILNLENSEILVHGLAMSPGKPAILARTNKTPIWGLPGHPASCFIVFKMAVVPFLKHLAGLNNPDFDSTPMLKARLTRNIISAPGRKDFVRVRLYTKENRVFAEPVPGESALIRTLASSQGLMEIPENKEGGLKDEEFFVHVLR